MSAIQHPRVVLYSKPGCHLCDVARPVVTRVSEELGVGWREVDISGDDALMRRFGEKIPVVLVDGQRHAYWHIDEAQLRAALQA